MHRSSVMRSNVKPKSNCLHGSCAGTDLRSYEPVALLKLARVLRPRWIVLRLSSSRCIKLGGETDSVIRWRTRTGVTSSIGTEEASCFFVFVSFSDQLWLFNGQVDDSTAGDFYFHPLNGSKHGSHPSLTTRDRELVSVLEVRIESGDLNPRPLTPQSVTLPTLPRAGC